MQAWSAVQKDVIVASKHRGPAVRSLLLLDDCYTGWAGWFAKPYRVAYVFLIVVNLYTYPFAYVLC